MFVLEALDAYYYELTAGPELTLGSGPEDTSFRVSFFGDPEFSLPTMTPATQAFRRP